MSQQSTRREFLKKSAVVAGAATQLGIARGAHAAGGDELKVALIGCGGRGTGAANDCMNAAKILNQPVKLIAVADAFADRARGALDRLKKEWSASIDVPEERVFTGLDAHQMALDCNPDVVLMASPPGFRPAQYAAAVKAGKHVFMEKPLCTDAPGYRMLVEANTQADQKGLKVVVGLQRRHQAGYLQGIQEIHEGKL
ncbi:MAG: Gfo/Idh/MocA family oxidoreductase, partial [Patescibacteria group bacterium]|nr:Gfo/Idh/MocA family oxidoreductase [Patescibacteria group bacterium]